MLRMKSKCNTIELRLVTRLRAICSAFCHFYFIRQHIPPSTIDLHYEVILVFDKLLKVCCLIDYLTLSTRQVFIRLYLVKYHMS